MTARHQFEVPGEIGAMTTADSYRAGVSPNSSAILAVTMMADVEDVLAVIRTATLLGKSFKASISVDLFGEDALHIEPGESLSQASLAKLLNVIQGGASNQRSSPAPVFALEASITAASFLAAGAITVHIRDMDSIPGRPTIAR